MPVKPQGTEVEEIKNKECALFLPVSLKTVTISALVDSGATVSVLSDKLFKDIFKDAVDIWLTPGKRVSGVDGRTLPILGKINIPIGLGGKSILHDVLICQGSGIEFILGKDFLYEIDASVHIRKQELTSQIGNFKLEAKSSVPYAAVIGFREIPSITKWKPPRHYQIPTANNFHILSESEMSFDFCCTCVQNSQTNDRESELDTLVVKEVKSVKNRLASSKHQAGFAERKYPPLHPNDPRTGKLVEKFKSAIAYDGRIGLAKPEYEHSVELVNPHCTVYSRPRKMSPELRKNLWEQVDKWKSDGGN